MGGPYFNRNENAKLRKEQEQLLKQEEQDI